MSKLVYKGIEEKWITAAIKQLIQAGYTMDQLKSEEFSKIATDDNHIEAIYNYIKRGEKLSPGSSLEPIKKPDKDNNYTFSFRSYSLLKPGEIQRIRCKPDLPYDKQGYGLKVQISDIEFN